MNRISCIYKIQSISYPERCYIGSAINFKNRRGKHLWELNKGIHGNLKLQRHYDKYGKDDLIFSVLLGCDEVDLIKIEQYFIDSYNPFFNLCKTAGSKLGIKLSLEQIEKTRKANTGQKRTDEAKEKMRKAKLGKPNYFNLGKKRSDETKLKLSKASKGRTSPNKGKPSPFRGVKNRYSEETLNKMRLSAKNRKK
jgi:group I intron endonuclease